VSTFSGEDQFEIEDVVRAIAPRRLLIVSATDDKYSKDADMVAASCKESFSRISAANALEHFRYSGGHDLTQERFEAILNWLEAK
jgi:predicted esterase